MQTLFSFLWPRSRSWLADHWPAIAGTALICLGLYLLLAPRGSPVPATEPRVSLSRKAVRRADQGQAARLDSIQREAQRLPPLLHARDSALTVARRQNARANSYLKLLSHEALPTTAAPAEHLARALANYQPGTYALDSTTSIR